MAINVNLSIRDGVRLWHLPCNIAETTYFPRRAITNSIERERMKGS